MLPTIKNRPTRRTNTILAYRLDFVHRYSRLCFCLSGIRMGTFPLNVSWLNASVRLQNSISSLWCVVKHSCTNETSEHQRPRSCQMMLYKIGVTALGKTALGRKVSDEPVFAFSSQHGDMP